MFPTLIILPVIIISHFWSCSGAAPNLDKWSSGQANWDMIPSIMVHGNKALNLAL